MSAIPNPLSSPHVPFARRRFRVRGSEPKSLVCVYRTCRPAADLMVSEAASGAMANTNTEKLTLLAKLVIAAGIALMVAGAMSHPVTIATVDRIWYQELARASAPMKFRFVLQPLMAAFLARRELYP